MLIIKITKEKVNEIQSLLNAYWSYDEIAKYCDVSKTTISNVKKGKYDNNDTDTDTDTDTDILPDNKRSILKNDKKGSFSFSPMVSYQEIQKALEIWSQIHQKHLISREKSDFLRDFILKVNNSKRRTINV